MHFVCGVSNSVTALMRSHSHPAREAHLYRCEDKEDWRRRIRYNWGGRVGNALHEKQIAARGSAVSTEGRQAGRQAVERSGEQSILMNFPTHVKMMMMTTTTTR